MIALTVLLVILCLAGAATALLLESQPKASERGDADKEEDICQPWSHVEQGPDSLFLSALGKGRDKRTTGEQ